MRSLSKYLSPKLSKSILAGKNVHVEAIDKPLTIFFSDMNGFSQLSEQLKPEKLAWLLNTYLAEMSEIVFRFGGTLSTKLLAIQLWFFLVTLEVVEGNAMRLLALAWHWP